MATPIWNEKEKRWTLRITENGIEKKFSSSKEGVAGKRAVLKKAREYLENGSVRVRKLTVNECWNKFMDMNVARLGEHSGAVKQYGSVGRLYILPAIGKRKIDTVRKADWQGILDQAKPLDGRRETLSKKYLDNIRCTIVKFVNFCDEYEYCDAFKGKLYIPHGHPKIGKDILQPSDIKKLFEPSDLHYHRAFCFMLCCGMRPGEVLGLQWKDIKSDYIHISRSVNNDGYLTDGKNDNARRDIPLTTFTSSLLEAQKTATRALKSEWVFCGIDGSMGNPHTMANQYARLRKERSLPGSLYSLRHTFVSMVKNSMPEQMVKTIVGHSASMPTFDIYGHTVNGELRQAAEIMSLTFSDLNSDII